MSLLQDLVGQLSGGQPSDQQQQNLLTTVAGLLNNPQIGGISGLARLFENQGLGQIVSGWIARGPNPPVSAEQLQQVLGSERIAEIARKLGVDPGQARAQLAAVLPQVVDHLTPDGVMPTGSLNTQTILNSLIGKFMGQRAGWDTGSDPRT